jgi:Sulfotransferase family
LRAKVVRVSRFHACIFASSVARSGGNLLSMMLNAHPHVTVACNAYLEVFRSFRNAVIRRSGDDALIERFPPSSPFQDYYFRDDRLRLLDLILSADPDLPFDADEWPTFIDACRARTALDCGELVPHLDALAAPTYARMIGNALDLAVSARRRSGTRVTGIMEVWVAEMFAPLARAWPDARFIILMRDPRAVVCSMLAIDRIDPMQVAHAISYARHWRKFAALALHFRLQESLRDRLLVVRYEEMLREPERFAVALAAHVGVESHPAMADSSCYFDFTTGSRWQGNSTFEASLGDIRAENADRWRQRLRSDVRELVEFLCGPEMRLLGYECGCDPPRLTPAALQYAVEAHAAHASWRTDLGDLQQDLGAELFRHCLLETSGAIADESLVRRSFLFDHVPVTLRAADATLLPTGMSSAARVDRPESSLAACARGGA